MNALPALQNLELNDLLLDNADARHLLDELCYSNCHKLRTLRLVNVSKEPCPLMHVGIFVALRELWLSPVTIGDEVVVLLGSSKVRDLIIYQDKHSEEAPPVNRKSWKKCAGNNPELRVHLLIQGPSVRRDHIWQPGAPVASVIYETPTSRISPWGLMTVVENYSQTLRAFGHVGAPHFQSPKKFSERFDSMLVLLCRSCRQLETLVIRERVSTCTLLLMASSATSLRRFIVRRNAVVLRNDWPANPEWTPVFRQWLKRNSRSYERTEAEIGSGIGHVGWKMLPDVRFKAVKLDVRQL
ncbi:unnamed protein product [Notodromas monacha]|uniref:Uncharacterized protein n=1 Tax=Notodromas monacha TaxID=399045 RepID=A0A7R9C278_9CRUS|nr:unnamed protein product [Notodromas monacha]CAG0924760.1 unnamed protein product [Notodromas monacha]